MMGRLILAILSDILEGIAIVVIVLWALPAIDVHLPLAGLIALMVVWGAYSVITYRIGSRALRRKQVVGLPRMVGSRGKVVSPLAPEGLVRIRDELWVAKSANGEMKSGGKVIVVGQDGLKLVVRDSSSTDDLEPTE
ncbi:MAG: NfeD family protein [Chloroflexi bacterium]|nr:NfeD family protein [Chloroflexota bacterium]